MSERRFVIIPVPSSAGAHGAGQELAPTALLHRGFVKRLRESGASVELEDGIALEPFQADPSGFPTRNLAAVIRVAEQVADAVAAHARTGRIPVVLGGDCTITIGVVAGIHRVEPDARLAYFDGDADLTSPERTSSGILDATGIAHLLGIADTALARIGDRFPLLDADAIALIGYDPTDPDSFDQAALDARPQLRHVPDRGVRDDPEAAIRLGLDFLAGHPAIVHFDVDAVDSADLPLADFPHYGTGVPLATAQRVLGGLLSTPDLRALVLTEVNPTKDEAGDQLDRYLDAVVAAIASASNEPEPLKPEPPES